jgi:hypothetical protein
MARKTRTKKGRAVYARRKAIVEPVFGQLDTVQDARRLLLRGKQAARAQWRFHCAVHNLLKLHRAGGLSLIGPQPGAGGTPPSRNGPRAAPRSALRDRAKAIRGWLARKWRPRVAISGPALVTDPRS